MVTTVGFDVRRVRPRDAHALRGFYAGLSAEARRARFMGTQAGVTAAQALTFCTPDHSHAEGFVALAADRVVGHLCLEPVDSRRVELAVAVADDWRGRGVGRRLLKVALDWAQRHAFAEAVASAYADNAAVLRLLSSAPFGASVGAVDGGVVDVVIPLRTPLPAPWRDVGVVNAGRHRRSRTDLPAAAHDRPHTHVVWRRRRSATPRTPVGS